MTSSTHDPTSDDTTKRDEASSDLLIAGMPKDDDVNWYTANEICLKDHHIPLLPDSPVCPSLTRLSSRVPRLTVIPPKFFANMSALKVLDLSGSRFMSLTPSISSLSSLEEFYLRDSQTMYEIPACIGMLTHLKLFDFEGTEIIVIPEEMGKLKELEVLRVSLSHHAKDYIEKYTTSKTIIPRKMISQLKKLKELCISVSSEADWWDEEVKDIQNELCDLENLKTLRWHLPTCEALHLFLLLERNQLPLYTCLSSLMLTVGQFAPLISLLPPDIEKEFDIFQSCLKWINDMGSMDDISKIMDIVEAFYVFRNWTIEKLSDFNLTTTKYCLLGACVEMETLVEAPEDVENGETGGLELLEYLSLHHMTKLHSIWKGPIGADSLSRLTVLALHHCPLLTTVFTPDITQNLSCLVELTVEGCHKVRRLISTDSNNVELGPILPRLKRIFLLDLPELENIFGCGVIKQELSILLVYMCKKLRALDINELPNIKKIEGDQWWWLNLNCNRFAWENIFTPIRKGRDWRRRIFEAGNSLQHYHDIVSNAAASQPKQGGDSDKLQAV